MSYAVKEIFLTIQGEGANSGRPAVFCRMAGCNLWSGRAEDRAGSCSAWCDTDFRVGTRMTAAEVAGRAAGLWRGERFRRFAVLTGGEPALQVDAPLLESLRREGFQIAIETNGTRPLPDGIDWVAVSPKAGTSLLVTAGDELKLPFPQEGVDPESFALLPFGRHYLQPIDGPAREANTSAARDYCLAHPKWRLGLQAHKTWGVA